MSTPASTPLDFYRGAAWSQIISFVQTGNEAPVDLTGLGPFVMELRERQHGSLLLSLTYTAIDLAGGQIQFSATAEQTLLLPAPISPEKPRIVRYGIRDANNNPYAEAIAYIRPFTPDPA